MNKLDNADQGIQFSIETGHGCPDQAEQGVQFLIKSGYGCPDQAEQGVQVTWKTDSVASEAGAGRPAKVPTDIVLAVVNNSDTFSQVYERLIDLGLIEDSKSDKNWLSCRLTTLRKKGYNIRKFSTKN